MTATISANDAAIADADERRNLRRRAGAIVAMARRAVLQVQRPAALAAGVRRQPAGPRQIVGVDVVQAGLRIEGLAAPFGAAVEAREHDRRALSIANGTNWPSLRKVLNCSSAHCRTAGVRVVSRSSVSSCRANGAGLSGTGCSAVASLHRARVLAGNFRYSIGKMRRAVRAIEEKQQPLLGGLRDSRRSSGRCGGW